MNRDYERRIYTVTQVNRHVKALIADDYVLQGLWISGEISNYKPHSAGHRYFTLKDNGGAISAVMFASDAASLSFIPENGQQVAVYGAVSLYEKTGQYQIYVRKMEPLGRGSLYQAYEELKSRLAAEGLFDAEHKKRIPAFPRTIGLLTSPTGAAVQDMIQIARRRFPGVSLVLYPCLVQGGDAAPTIVAGLRALDALPEVELIIVGRGGGSIEDLWAFNEEAVARAIYDCGTPVISAVGHETDFTIADFVSDLRAPTPSAAAELAVPEVRAELEKIRKTEERMQKAVTHRISLDRSEIRALCLKLSALSPESRIREQRQQTDLCRERLNRCLNDYVRECRRRLELARQRIGLLDPLQPLEKGYAFVTDQTGSPISSVKGIVPGQSFTVRLADGRIGAAAEKIIPNED